MDDLKLKSVSRFAGDRWFLSRGILKIRSRQEINEPKGLCSIKTLTNLLRLFNFLFRQNLLSSFPPLLTHSVEFLKAKWGGFSGTEARNLHEQRLFSSPSFPREQTWVTF